MVAMLLIEFLKFKAASSWSLSKLLTIFAL
jgi:hypothetical protein